MASRSSLHPYSAAELLKPPRPHLLNSSHPQYRECSRWLFQALELTSRTKLNQQLLPKEIIKKLPPLINRLSWTSQRSCSIHLSQTLRAILSLLIRIQTLKSQQVQLGKNTMKILTSNQQCNRHPSLTLNQICFAETKVKKKGPKRATKVGNSNLRQACSRRSSLGA